MPFQCGAGQFLLEIPGASGGNPLEIQDEGVSLTTQAKLINFVGLGVTATETAPDEVTVTIPGGAGAGTPVNDVDLPTLQAGVATVPNVLTPLSLGLITNFGLGQDQAAVGIEAGDLNTGNYQVAMGTRAGKNNTGGSQVAIGYQAGQNNTGTNQVAIGVSAGASSSVLRQVAIGFSAGSGSSGNVCIGDTAGQGSTSTGVYIGPSAGYQLLKSVFGGTVAVGSSAGYKSVGDRNTFLGTTAGFQGLGGSPVVLNGDENIGIGADSCRGVQGDQNVFIGVGTAPDFAGNSNVGVGHGVFVTNTGSSGSFNVAIGYQACSGVSSFSADHVIALGYFAGKENVQSNRLIVGHSNLPQFADAAAAAAALPAPALNGGVYLYWDLENDCVRIGGGAVGSLPGGGGGGSITVQDEGTPLTTAVTLFNFVGNGVSVTAPTANQMQVSIPGLRVDDEGSQVNPGTIRLNFVGAGVTATSGGGGLVNVSIPGGAGAFSADINTIVTPTNPITIDTGSAQTAISLAYEVDKGTTTGDNYGVEIDATVTNLGSFSQHYAFGIKEDGQHILRYRETSARGELTLGGVSATGAARIQTFTGTARIDLSSGVTLNAGSNSIQLVADTVTISGSMEVGERPGGEAFVRMDFNSLLTWSATEFTYQGLFASAYGALGMTSTPPSPGARRDARMEFFETFGSGEDFNNFTEYRKGWVGFDNGLTSGFRVKTDTNLGFPTAQQTRIIIDPFGDELEILGVMFLEERAASMPDLVDRGQVWVKDDEHLWFTTASGTDYQISHPPQSGSGETTGHAAVGGTNVNSSDTFTGNVGATAYTINDVVKALKNLGHLAL